MDFLRNTLKTFIYEFANSHFNKNSLNSIKYDDFSDIPEFQLSGPAQLITTEFDGKKGIRLTNDYNQVGKLLCLNDINIGESGEFATEFNFKLSNPRGAGDADGVGADGIKFILEGEKGEIGIFIDTYHNWEDSSGNHIDLEINGQNVLQGYVDSKLNNGNIFKLRLEYKNNLLIVHLSEEENDFISTNEDENKQIVPILAYPINIIKHLGGQNIRITFVGMTGAGAQNQDILTWEFYSRDSIDM
jgi:hypothetical protein